MKRLLCTLYLLPTILIAIPFARAQAEDVVVDVDNPDTNLTYVTLAWDPNPEQNIAGYIVYYGRASGSYLRLITVTEAAVKIGVPPTKTTYFAVTAFDTNGLESDFSDEVQWP